MNYARGTPEWHAWRAKLSSSVKSYLASNPRDSERIMKAVIASAATRRGKQLSEEHKARVSAALKGRKRTPEHQAKLNAAHTGRPKSQETRLRISNTLTGRPGRPYTEEMRAKQIATKRVKYADRITRSTWRYKEWRLAVIEKAGGVCSKCGSSKALHAHHVEPWEDVIARRYDVDNGEALCAACHLKEHRAGRVMTDEQRKKHSERIKEWWRKRRGKI